MKKLLIINKTQFGYHIDSYKYCQYLKNYFEITYICLDTKKPKIYEDNINIIYVQYQSSYLKRGLNYIKTCRSQIKNKKYDFIFLVYFIMALFVKLGISKENFILDIRTGSVNKSFLKRFIANFILKIETLFFKKITIISICLRKQLNISSKKSHILPLGSDPISNNAKNFDNINLLYVGTLHGRDIYKTIIALSKFIKNNKITYNISYDIIGFGTKEDEQLLIKTIKDENLNDKVIFHGRITHDKLIPYFTKANIGVSFIPLIKHYQCQPPTKTFEYINSGLFCIATNTYEHERLISSKNGILCQDNIESFILGLEKFESIRDTLNSNIIKNTLKNHSWEKIIKNNLLNYLLEKNR